jgi:hypothetical protein
VKKLSLALLGMLIIAAIYYFTTGSEQLRNQMKTYVNTELKTLQSQGFSVQNREILEKEEHFILSFDEPRKIAHYLKTQGVQIHPQDLETMQGFKVGADVKYLPDTYSAVTFDIYPVALPTAMKSPSLSREDQKIVAQLDKLIEKKAILIHLALNKLGTGFKGHMKDMDEVIEGERKGHLVLKGLTFSGDMEKERVTSLQQKLGTLTLEVESVLSMQLANLNSNFHATGTTAYDYKTDYTIGSVSLHAQDQFKILMDKLHVTSDSLSKEGLVSGTLHSKVDKVDITESQYQTILQTVLFDMKVDNLHMQAFEKLQSVDVNNDREVTAVLQELISKGIVLDIQNFSIDKITTDGQTMNGLTLNSKMNIDKSLDIQALQQNPLIAINAINANLHIALSQGLFGMVAQHPQAVLAMMLFQPKEVNNQKVYKIELQNGSLKINDIPAL